MPHRARPRGALRALLAASLVALVPVRAPSGAAQLEAPQGTGCEGHAAELAAGQLVVTEEEPSGGRGVALQVCGVVDAAPAQVWAVVRDCGSYDQFMPHVKRSRLAHRDGNIACCDTVVALPSPLGELHSVTRVIETARPDGGFERRWTLLRGTYRHNEGSWTVQPWEGDVRRTLAVYRLDSEPDTLLPGFLLRRIQSETAQEVFDAVRERVRRCAASDPPAGCAGHP